MAKREYIYVECFGGLWRLSQSAWKRYLRDHAKTGDTNLDKYGKMIAGNVEQVTDLTQEEAKYQYELYN